MAETKLVGVDVGGTFTDLVVVDEASGRVQVAKVPPTGGTPAPGAVAALGAASASTWVVPSPISWSWTKPAAACRWPRWPRRWRTRPRGSWLPSAPHRPP